MHANAPFNSFVRKKHVFFSIKINIKIEAPHLFPVSRKWENDLKQYEKVVR